MKTTKQLNPEATQLLIDAEPSAEVIEFKKKLGMGPRQLLGNQHTGQPADARPTKQDA